MWSSPFERSIRARSISGHTDMQEKLKDKLRDMARRRQTRIATRDLRGSARCLQLFMHLSSKTLKHEGAQKILAPAKPT